MEITLSTYTYLPVLFILRNQNSLNYYVQNILMEYIALTNFKIYYIEPEKDLFHWLLQVLYIFHMLNTVSLSNELQFEINYPYTY